MLFLEYPKCSTCQKAKKWLDDHGIAYEDRHIKEQNPSAEELKAWHEKSGFPLKKFFNTSGMLYKEMQLKDKLPQMSEEEQMCIRDSGTPVCGRQVRRSGTGRFGEHRNTECGTGGEDQL